MVYYDDCNETELYSQESMTERWTGRTDNDDFGEYLTEEATAMAKKRNEYSRQSLELRENCRVEHPTFSKWTLYDPVQCRIYATFESVDDVLAFIKHDQFKAFWSKMKMDRDLAFSKYEINYRWMSNGHTSTVDPYFAVDNVKLQPEHCDVADEEYCIYLPTSWELKKIVDHEDQTIKRLERAFHELNENWKDDEEELPW